MEKENEHQPNPTDTSGDAKEGKGLPPAKGKAVWTTPTLTILAGERTEWNPSARVTSDDGLSS